MEECNLPHPLSHECDIFVPCKALNGRHPSTAMCNRGRERKYKRLVAEEAQAVAEETVFQAYGHPLSTISSFKYL